jgi:hypothetical protein
MSSVEEEAFLYGLLSSLELNEFLEVLSSLRLAALFHVEILKVIVN